MGLFPEGIEPRFRSELNEAHDSAKRVAKKIQESDGQSNHKMPDRGGISELKICRASIELMAD